jgi:hypothetical protein
VRLAGGVEDVGREDPCQRNQPWTSGPPFRRRAELHSNLAGRDRDGPRDALFVRHRVGRRCVRAHPRTGRGRRSPRSAHRRTAWANSVGSSGWGCTAGAAGRTATR